MQNLTYNQKILAAQSFRNSLSYNAFALCSFGQGLPFIYKNIMTKRTQKSTQINESDLNASNKALKTLQEINDFKNEFSPKRTKKILWEMLFFYIASENTGSSALNRAEKMYFFQQMNKLVRNLNKLNLKKSIYEKQL